MSAITEDMYLLAKQIVANYEAEANAADYQTRSYTHSDMKTCFVAGFNRGCYIASLIHGNPIDEYDAWEQFIVNHSKTK